MAFEKGKSGNPKGKRNGTKNFATTEAKEIVLSILKRNLTITKVNRDLKQLNPQRRLEVLLKLLQFTLPRPTDSTLKFDINSMASDRVDELYKIIFSDGNK